VEVVGRDILEGKPLKVQWQDTGKLLHNQSGRRDMGKLLQYMINKWINSIPECPSPKQH
jgi:hypothetical protein